MIHDPIYPDAPGHRGIDTSIEAANSIADKLGRLQKLALAGIEASGLCGCTTDELAERLEMDRSSIQPRTSELRRKGLVKDSKRRRKNASGKNAIVWVAAEPQGDLFASQAVGSAG